MRWLRVRWRKARNQPPGAVNWRRDASGAMPVTPREVRRVKRGTAAMAANRGSEKMNRLLRSGLVATLELMLVIVIATLFGRFLYAMYEGASIGRAILQSIIAAIAGMVWLNLTHNRYRDETRKAIAHERSVQLRAATTHQGTGADPAQQIDRTARLDRVDPTGAKDAPTTEFERHFDQRHLPDEPL
jgi:hypothetical protein